ncbi:DUF3971 domain-containing protein [soil metagenome]
MVGAAVFWRLTQGPISLNFVRENIQAEINASLGGMSVKLGGVVIERDAKTGVPHLRLRNVELADQSGEIIARAPRAAVAIDGSALLRGSVVAKQIDLIGPRILVKRNIRGEFELGFGLPAGQAEGNGETANSGKADMEQAELPLAPEVRGGTLLDFLSGKLPGEPSANASIASLDAVVVTDAAIQLLDEVNGSVWNIPKASLAFKRMPFGFAFFSEASVASGDRPWHTELSASYRRDTGTFSVSARIFDLVIADLADEVFALSKLAQVKLPLSGHAEFEITENAQIVKASAELSAAAGQVGFPGYISAPIIVDEGLIRLDYDPATGGIAIRDSVILVGGTQAQLTGKVDPVRDTDGRLTDLKIAISARNLSLDTAGTVRDALAIDRVDFTGVASVRSAHLDVEDFVVMAGQAGLRVHGSFTGGEKSAGIRLAGRIRDMPAPVLKKLWPPIVAPNTRNWVNANILEGTIADGEFTINLPVDALDEALKAKLIPNDSIDARFKLGGVSTKYFSDLPPITGASGTARLQGDYFGIVMDGGLVTLPSGRSLQLKGGTMDVTALLAPITPATFAIKVETDVAAAFEYMALPPLNLVQQSGLDLAKLKGRATVDINLGVPLSRDVQRNDVKVSATGKIADASLQGALAGIDLDNGQIAISITGGAIKAEGPVKINGLDAKVSWARAAGSNPAQTAVLTLDLDDAQRKKLGVDISDYLKGPVGLQVTLPAFREDVKLVNVVADLSDADLRLEAIGWSRAGTKDTTASFSYAPDAAKGGQISDLVVKGDGLLIKGDISLDSKGGLGQASFPTIILNEDNRFGLVLNTADGNLNAVINGASFDARPLIKSLFDTRGKAKTTKDAKDGSIVTIDAAIDRVYAHRGEIVTGVTGKIVMRGDTVQRANISGAFVSGEPINIRMEPQDGGTRELRVGGRDAGAALRAANLYSKVSGGQINFSASLGAGGDSSLRDGKLVLRDFAVRDEAALSGIDQKGRGKKTGPRRDGMTFSRLTLPFTSDSRFIRIGDTLIRGPDMGATAQGIIRKADGAIDIDGTIIPAYQLNSAIGEIPIVGDIVTGGKGQGMFALSYALGGTMKEPRFQVNPVSAIAPGIIRKLFFEYGSAGSPPQTKLRGSTQR